MEGFPSSNRRDCFSAQSGKRGYKASFRLPNWRAAPGRPENRLVALKWYNHLLPGLFHTRCPEADSSPTRAVTGGLCSLPGCSSPKPWSVWMSRSKFRLLAPTISCCLPPHCLWVPQALPVHPCTEAQPPHCISPPPPAPWAPSLFSCFVWG